jgi:hypothetical protein
MQKALRLDHSSFTTEENTEWINNQNELILSEQEYRRILRQLPAEWNAYCKRVKEVDAQLIMLEQKYADLPKGLPGAPQTDEITLAAIELQRRGLNLIQIAEALSKKFNKKYKSDAIRKRIERFNARTKAEG